MELVLLLLIDSLIQLLLLQQQFELPKTLSGGVRLLVLADFLLAALPLLLYAFGPWHSKEDTSDAKLRQESSVQEDVAAAEAAAAAAVLVAAAAEEETKPQSTLDKLSIYLE